MLDQWLHSCPHQTPTEPNPKLPEPYSCPQKKQFFYHILHQIASTDWSQKVRLLQQCKGLSRTLHSAGKCFDCPVVATSEILKTPAQFRPGEMCSILVVQSELIVWPENSENQNLKQKQKNIRKLKESASSGQVRCVASPGCCHALWASAHKFGRSSYEELSCLNSLNISCPAPILFLPSTMPSFPSKTWLEAAKEEQVNTICN